MAPSPRQQDVAGPARPPGAKAQSQDAKFRLLGQKGRFGTPTLELGRVYRLCPTLLKASLYKWCGQILQTSNVCHLLGASNHKMVPTQSSAKTANLHLWPCTGAAGASLGLESLKTSLESLMLISRDPLGQSEAILHKNSRPCHVPLQRTFSR